MESDSRLVRHAPAKINVYLKIIGKRSDGYHELVSWMQKVTLYDTLTLQVIPSGIHLHCPGSKIPQDSGNLAYKAALIFFDQMSIKSGVDIILEKKIPVAAGLGGGSSDAACVLNGLNTLYKTGCSEKKMKEMALQIGADVPFFVCDAPSAWAAGIGEKLHRNTPMPQCWIVLVNPGFSVSTKWVYDNLALTSDVNPDTFTRFTDAAESSDARKTDLPASAAKLRGLQDEIMNRIDRFSPNVLFNDLERVTSFKYPEISVMKEKLLEANAAGVLMSGSGPTVFGVFDHRQDALRCQIHLEQDYPDNVFLVEPIRT